MDFSGILLAGGKSRRFIPNKIKIMSGGVPLLVEQIVKLGFFTSEVIICTSLENRAYISSVLQDLDHHINKLKIPGGHNMPAVKILVDDNMIKKDSGSIGPIAGIYTGLRRSVNDYGIVMASDMPFISFRLLRLLTDKAGQAPKPDAVIIRNSKGIEALCGIYSKKCIKIIEESITGGSYKISDILDGLEVRWIEPEELVKEKIDIYNFFNINLPEDIEEFGSIRGKGVAGYGTNNIGSGTGQKWKDNFFRGTCKGAYREKI